MRIAKFSQFDIRHGSSGVGLQEVHHGLAERIVGLLQNGETIDSLPTCFPQITRAQIYECLAYYEDHGGEIDLLIARQMAGLRIDNVRFFAG